MNITKDEAYIVYQGLTALGRNATSDEPHTAHTAEFSKLLKEVRAYAEIENIVSGKKVKNVIKLNTRHAMSIGEMVERDGKTYRVVDNDSIIVTTVEEV